MEFLLLLLLLPVVWLLLLPSRVAGTVRRYRYASAGLLAAVALGGLLLLMLNHPGPVTDYAKGDAELRNA